MAEVVVYLYAEGNRCKRKGQNCCRDVCDRAHGCPVGRPGSRCERASFTSSHMPGVARDTPAAQEMWLESMDILACVYINRYEKN